jgi:hypothetical protein
MEENLHKDFSYGDTAKHLKKLLLQLCTVKVKKKIEDVKYEGDDIESSSILATSFKISESFTEKQLDYDKERGRDALDVFINKVFQLGYSVGYEKSKENYRSQIMLGRGTLEKSILKRKELSPEVIDKVKEMWKNINNEE